MRASASHEVILSAVQVPADHAVDLRHPSQWPAPDPTEAAWLTLPIAALYDGVARAARDWLIRYLTERTPVQSWRAALDAAALSGGGRRNRWQTTHQPGFDSHCRGACRLGQAAQCSRKRAYQADRHEQCDRRRPTRDGAGRQPGAQPAQPAGAALSRRPVQPRSHAAKRQYRAERGSRRLRGDQQLGECVMDVEFIGMIATREYSEIHPPQGPAIDLDYVRRFAQAHECSGFDRILIGYFSNGPDGFIVASYAAAATERLGLMLAHRPGFVAPTLAARKLATLDQFTGGRLAVHIISGGDDGEQQKDGDYLEPSRSLRAHGRVRRDSQAHLGERGADRSRRPLLSLSIRLLRGQAAQGASADLFRRIVAGGDRRRRPACGHLRALGRAARAGGRNDRQSAGFGGALPAQRRASAFRCVRFSHPPRPRPGSGPSIFSKPFGTSRGQGMLGPANGAPQNVGSQRLLAAAARGEVLDKRLWTAVAAATGARGNTTALVGTPEQVAESLLAYYDLGVTTFLIRGFDPLAGRDRLWPGVDSARAPRSRPAGLERRRAIERGRLIAIRRRHDDAEGFVE